MVPFAHASDGLGSIRIPAACCGLVGLKPTRDRTPTGGDDTNIVIGMTCNHVVSRSVRDSAAVLDAVDAPEPYAPFAAPAKPGPWLAEVGKHPGRLRIGWSTRTPGGKPIDGEVEAAMARTIDLLERLGHDVREAPLELDWRAFYRAQARMSAANFSAEIKIWAARLGREPGEDIEPLARRGYLGGQRISGADALGAMQELKLMARRLLEQFATMDVYLTPVMGTPPPRLDELVPPLTEDYAAFDKAQARTYPFTPPFNVTGQPSLSLPLWQSDGGLPIGMMFTARYADEVTLFRLAGQLERELPWAGRTPPIWD
jgi:amidase